MWGNSSWAGIHRLCHELVVIKAQNTPLISCNAHPVIFFFFVDAAPKGIISAKHLEYTKESTSLFVFNVITYGNTTAMWPTKWEIFGRTLELRKLCLCSIIFKTSLNLR